MQGGCRPEPAAHPRAGAASNERSSAGLPPGDRPGAPGAKGARADLVVVAPHPDDEVLLAAGLMASRVAAGRKVAVVVVTNGDFTCERDGFERQNESVRALALLGLTEGDIDFLGYPDGHLQDLSRDPLPPVERRDEEGRCVRGNTTYGRRGHGGADEHTARTGAPAVYSSSALVGDLAAVFSRLRPREIVVPHPLDAHPDHAMTYAYVRRAFDTLSFAPERILRGVVHAGPCWPNSFAISSGGCRADPFHPEAPTPPLPAPFGGYAPRERFLLPPSMRAVDPRANGKMRAISVYRSQTGPDPVSDWLASFARADEVFWPESWVSDGEGSRRRWIRARGAVPEAPVTGLAAEGMLRERGGASGPQYVHRVVHFERDAPPLSIPLPFGAGDARGAPFAYRLVLDPRGASIQLWRDRGAALRNEATDRQGSREGRSKIGQPGPRASDEQTAVLVRQWGAPEGDFSGAHALDLSYDVRPDDGGAVETSLWIDDELLGVAIEAGSARPPPAP